MYNEFQNTQQGAAQRLHTAQQKCRDPTQCNQHAPDTSTNHRANIQERATSNARRAQTSNTRRTCVAPTSTKRRAIVEQPPNEHRPSVHQLPNKRRTRANQLRSLVHSTVCVKTSDGRVPRELAQLQHIGKIITTTSSAYTSPSNIK